MNITKKTKSVIYIVIGVLIVLGLIYAFNQYRESHNKYADLSVNEIKKLDEKAQKQALESRINALEKEINALKDTTDISARYIAYIGLAEAKLELSDYSGALSALDSIPETKKSNSRVLQAYGFAFKGLGDTNKAKEYIDKALILDDTDAKTWLAKIELNSDLPNDQLNGLYRQAIPATKSNVDIMVSYAKFSEKIGDKATAIAAWETAINGNPEKENEYRAEIARLRQ